MPFLEVSVVPNSDVGLGFCETVCCMQIMTI